MTKKKRYTKNNKNQTIKYNWEGINFPTEKNDQKKDEKNNVTIAFKFLYAKK